MHGPAPVSLEPAGDGGGWRWAVILLHTLAATAVFAWRPGVATLVAALALLAAGVWVSRTGAAAGTRLAWDGQAWALDGRPVSALVALDLGGWMLLQLRDAAGRHQVLPLSPARAGAVWPALRTALYGAPTRAG